MKIITSVLFPFLLARCAVVPQPAELIVSGGTVWTGTRAHPLAQAVAVRGSRIVFVGSNESVLRFKGPATRHIQLHGELVVPGFTDSHTHFISGGFSLGSVDLRPARSPREFTALLRDFARSLPTGRWITEGNWDHEAWGGAL